jgi:hypothetical protein
VVFPAPFGPSNAKTLPLLMNRSMPSNTVSFLNDFLNPFTTIALSGDISRSLSAGLITKNKDNSSIYSTFAFLIFIVLLSSENVDLGSPLFTFTKGLLFFENTGA